MSDELPKDNAVQKVSIGKEIFHEMRAAPIVILGKVHHDNVVGRVAGDTLDGTLGNEDARLVDGPAAGENGRFQATTETHIGVATENCVGRTVLLQKDAGTTVSTIHGVNPNVVPLQRSL